MDPIRPITRSDDTITAIEAVADSRVRRESPDEAHERRQREQRDRARKHAARAWADAQLRAVQAQHEPVLVSEEDSDDGHPHCDVTV